MQCEEEEDLKVNWKAIFKLGREMIKPVRHIYLLLLILTVGAITIGVYQAVVLSELPAMFSNLQSINIVRNKTFLFAALVLGNIIISYLEMNLTDLFTTKITTKFQSRLHDKVISLGVSYHRDNPLGKTSAVVNQFSIGAVMTVMQIFNQPITTVYALVLSIKVLLDQLSTAGNFPLYMKIIMVFLIITIPFVSYFLSERIKKNSFQQNAAMVQANEEYNNSATNPLSIQLLQAEKQRSKSYNKALEDQEKIILKANYLNNFDSLINSSISPILQALFILVLVLISGNNLGSLENIAGSIILFIMLIPQALSPVQQIIGVYTGININWPMIKEVVDLLNTENDVQDTDDSIEIGSSKSLNIKNLSFAYNSDSKILLDNVTFGIESGKIVGIVAKSGTGKSTLFKLLTKQHDNYKGSISIGNQDIRNVKMNSLRSKVILISQFPYFISGTVRDNFKLIKEDVTDEEIISISKTTGFYETLLKLTNGKEEGLLDLDISRENSGQWSGGERKIFSLTRTLLLDPSILLIDEQVTGLSPIDVERVLGVMKKVIHLDQLKGDTMLVVEHNPQYLKELCDEIICFADGKISERGTPEDLINNKGMFYTMLNSMNKEENND